jgi:hypothetical protein
MLYHDTGDAGANHLIIICNVINNICIILLIICNVIINTYILYYDMGDAGANHLIIICNVSYY